MKTPHSLLHLVPHEVFRADLERALAEADAAMEGGPGLFSPETFAQSLA